MQLCKCLDCFLKAHNKQINLYCLLFFLTKKNSFKKWFRFVFGSWVELSWPAKNAGQVTGQPIFASGQKKGFRLGRVKKFQPIFPCTEKKKFNKIFINMYVWVWMNHMNKKLKIIGWDRASWNSCHEFKIEKTNAFVSGLRLGWFRSSLHPPELWPNKNRVWQEGNWPNPNIQVLG